MICDSKESPFDYDSHAIIYYTENLPHPSNEREAFIEKGVDKVINLLNITEGKTLSNLIIFRLPFPVPEPIIDYKRSISKDGLIDVSVPEMIIKLKQGIGRIIRNRNDSGIVSIIDSRLGDNSNVPYKQLTWDALPIKNRTNDIEKAKEFYLKLTDDISEQ